ncbi:Las1-like-domain-containing protein [Umbelopsis sp. PMI_123]|nr:Las1-like-domain-containing protein [Umbelopsis sp. PMI_123]
MPRIPRIVPWSSYQELEDVYNMLYFDGPEAEHQRDLGVQRVKAWKSRGKVPHAIQMTATFIEVQLRDQFAAGPARISQHELRLMYTMAFVRFVNGIVDPAQRGQFAVSVSILAERLQLPLWFVELRHAGTHEYLPSLQVLRNGCHQALMWLHDFYWMVALKPDGSAPLTKSSMSKIRDMLGAYKEARKRQLKERRTIKSTESRECSKAIKKIVATVSTDVIRDGLIPVLIDVGGIVPAGKKKRPTTASMSLSEDLIDLWTPLLRNLDVNFGAFAEELIAALLAKITIEEDIGIDKNLIGPFTGFFDTADENEKNLAHTSSSYMATIAAWLKYIIESSANRQQNASSGILQDVMVDDILEHCLKNPNFYTRYLLTVMSNAHPKLGDSIQPFLIYIDNVLSTSQKKLASVPELNDADMEAELDRLNNHVMQSKQMALDNLSDKQDIIMADCNANGWSLYSESKWNACPLGCLPDGSVPRLELPLELDFESSVPMTSEN